MARTNPRSSSDQPSSASNATSSGRVSKSRSGPSSSRSRSNRQRNQALEAASSSGMLQSMVDETQDVVAGSSSSGKGKSRANVVSDPAPTTARPRRNSWLEINHPDFDTDYSDAEEDDEDVDMQQALLDSVPANEVCPIVDKNTKPFPIMDLPTEIRLEIYRACLTRPYDILLSKRDKPSQRRRKTDKDADRNELSISDSHSDVEETDEDNDNDNQTPTPQTPQRELPSMNLRRRGAGHGLRSLTNHGGRPIRLISSRSAPGVPHGENGAGNSSGTASGSTQAGAAYAPPRTTRFVDRRHSSRSRTVSAIANEPPRNQTQDPLLVNILRASKEIYKEARSVLYNENKFTLDLDTAMSTLSLLHQRSRRQIKHVELEIPTYNEILERFQETVRLSLRYCTGLKTFVIHMPFTLPGADGSGTTGNTTVYANGFDILRWLPQECNIVLRGNICSEIEVVVNKHMHLAKVLDKVSHQYQQYRPMDTLAYQQSPLFRADSREKNVFST